MLKFGSVFVGDYAITGGFFICAQLLLMVWAYPDITVAAVGTLSHSLTDRLNDLPSAVQPAVISLLVALTLLSVFFFGLLLDLAGSVYVIWELSLFRINIERNRSWLTKFVDTEFQEYAGDDFSKIVSGVDATPLARQVFRSFLLWRRSSWSANSKGWKSWRLVSAFERMEQLFISYVLDTQGEARVNWLNEKIRLCRMSRAITIALLTVLLEFYIAALPVEINKPIVLFVPFSLGVLAVFVTGRAYSRFCTTLFAMVYTQMRSEQDKQTEAKVQDQPTKHSLPMA